MRRFASLAEKYRHHRKCFELALELGCTPREAEIEMDRMAARERARALAARYGVLATRHAARADIETVTDFRAWEARWMLRD